MRKIIVFNLISVDGYFAGKDGDISWHNVDDEYKLLVNPVILGKGKPMFANLKDKLNLKLLNTKTFKNGNVLLSYVTR